MAKKGKQENNAQNNSPNNVIALPTSCAAENCGSKAKRAGFCEEHFMWFKEGLVRRNGEKAKDFDKKYQAFLRRQRQAA